MKFPPLLPLVLVLAVAACNSSTPQPGNEAQPSPSPAPAATSTPGAAPSPAAATASGPQLSPTVPSDLPPSPAQADAVTFAWQQFVALNWPALEGMRGVPDTSKMIGQQGNVVWHTWKTPDEIFYPNGKTPEPWNDYGGQLPSQCTGAGATRMSVVLTRTSKVPGGVMNASFQQAKQAVGGTLTDQNKNLVRYEVRQNRTIFDAIVASQFYNTQGQDAATRVSFPPGVMEVKASWRQIMPNEPSSVTSRYFTQKAYIYTPQFGPNPPTCVVGTLGLVGLHISQKTATRPQWTWATFEQVDNVAPAASGYNGPFSLYNPNCVVAMCPPNQSTEKNGIPTGIPTQVVRRVPIGQAAGTANQAWQQALSAVSGSPFQYYQLIDIQWPQTPSRFPVGNPTPGLLSNVTMETYVVESSCVNCHFTARTASSKLSSDYSFLLAEAKSAGASGSAR